MKISRFDFRKRGWAMAFLGSLTVSSALAVERPSEFDEETPDLRGASIVPLDAEEVESLTERKVPVIEAVPRVDEVAVEAIPYLGVGSMPLDDLLLDHLGLEHGVVLKKVYQGSGAFKAGLLKNDILLKFNGDVIGSPLDLRDSVSNCKVGDKVVVEFLRGGERREDTVQLEERPEGLSRAQPLKQLWPNNGQMPQDALEQIDRLRSLIDEEFNDVGLGIKLSEMLGDGAPDNEGHVDFDMNAESSVTWSDAQGTITMRMLNGSTEVVVTDNSGEVIYEGPWESAEDKAAVDPEVRARIDNMGVEQSGNQLKFLMEGLPRGR